MNYKNTIRLLAAAAVLLAAVTAPAGCRKVEEERPAPAEEPVLGEFSGLHAMVVDDFACGGELAFGGVATKAWFSQPYKVGRDTIRGRMQEFWDNQDEVNVNGKILKAAVPQGERKLERFCRLVGAVGGNHSGAMYEGYFPKNIYQKIDGLWTRSFPAEQKRETSMGGSRLKIPNAMYAEENDTILRFRNICGLLELALRGDGYVKNITVQANAPLSGLYDIDVTEDIEDPDHGLREFDARMLDVNSRDSVVLTCPTATPLAPVGGEDSTLFYISLPPVTFDTLTVTVRTTDDYVYIKKFIGKTTIRKNEMYVTCIDIDRWGVQMWAKGPVWSVKNLGATEVYEPGDWFAWAAERPWYETATADTVLSDWREDFERGYVLPNAKYRLNDGSYNKYTATGSKLKTADDAASQAWSINWKVPAKADFQTLLDSCNCSWTDNYEGGGYAGYEFTSRSGYTTATLFLPAAGKASGTRVVEYGATGDYWTSETGATPDKAARLKFTATDAPALSDTSRAAGFSIRPVHPY